MKGLKYMLLAVDIGNTSIDFGIFDELGNLKMKSKISSVRSKTADEYAATLNGIFAVNGFSAKEITGSIVSSVVPSLTSAVKQAVRKLTGIAPLEVGPGIRTGLNIKIDVQTQLGADIVANSVAVVSAHRCPVIMIDVGTATTFTVIDGEGVLEGVIIAPGLRVSLDALAESAAELTDVSLSPPKRFVGKNTRDSVCSGALYGHAFMIDGFVERIRLTQGFAEAEVIITGGLAETVLPLCSVKAKYEPGFGFKRSLAYIPEEQEMICRESGGS